MTAAMSQVNGKLSNRVMNMKFMRFAKDKNDDVPSDSESSKRHIHDGSQWSFKDDGGKAPKKPMVIRKRPKAKTWIVRDDVSITDIKRGSSPVIRGRRVVGDVKEESSDKPDGTSKRNRDNEENDEYDLEKIFKQAKADKGDYK